MIGNALGSRGHPAEQVSEFRFQDSFAPLRGFSTWIRKGRKETEVMTLPHGDVKNA